MRRQGWAELIRPLLLAFGYRKVRTSQLAGSLVLTHAVDHRKLVQHLHAKPKRPVVHRRTLRHMALAAPGGTRRQRHTPAESASIK